MSLVYYNKICKEDKYEIKLVYISNILKTNTYLTQCKIYSNYWFKNRPRGSSKKGRIMVFTLEQVAHSYRKCVF